MRTVLYAQYAPLLKYVGVMSSQPILSILAEESNKGKHLYRFIVIQPGVPEAVFEVAPNQTLETMNFYPLAMETYLENVLGTWEMMNTDSSIVVRYPKEYIDTDELLGIQPEILIVEPKITKKIKKAGKS